MNINREFGTTLTGHYAFIRELFAVAALSVAWTAPVAAAPITTLYDTGVDDSGAVLSSGTSDSHRSVQNEPDFTRRLRPVGNDAPGHDLAQMACQLG